MLHNYDFLPDGYSDIIVIVETLDEIFTEKIVSFVNCQSESLPDRLRYRDIWDLYWLKQQGATVNMALVKKKIDDYKIDNYIQKLDKMIEQLQKIIDGKKFKDEMARFLPRDVQERTLLNKKYLYLLWQEIYAILKTLGFEWKEKNGDIYCTNILRNLDKTNFEQVWISMSALKDKYGLVVCYGKKSQELIVASSNESIAKELSKDPTYKSSLPKGYKVDHALQPGQWYIKFTESIV